ncbi:MAG TPA: ATP-binding protein [Dictyobacter sp.]|jgi:signal transduction histidine kinase/GAF domain-containing protein|nr:ATP-binding protein [Dictyobacter sp.]
MDVRAQNSTLAESAIIERVARIVFSVRGTKPDYTRLAAELEQAVPFDVFGVVLLRHDKQAVRVIVCRRNENSWVADLHQHPLSDSMLEQLLAKPELRVRDYPDGIDGLPAASGDALSRYYQLRSTLIVPLIVEGRVLGTLELGSTALHTYADESLQRMVNAVVPVLAAAIESVQLGGNAAIQDRQREVLKDVTRAITAKKDLTTVLEQIVNGIASALNVCSGIFLLDQHERALHLEAFAGIEPEIIGRVFPHDQPVRLAEQCIFSRTITRRQVQESSDLSRDELFPASHCLFTELSLRSIYCYPLATGTVIYGTIFICSPENGGFTPLKTDILALFANQATVAIHNDRLFQSVHQRSRFQEVVEQLEQAHKKRLSAPAGQDVDEIDDKKVSLEEFELFERVRAETQRTFGVSFSSVLHAISDKILTQKERDLQSIISDLQQQQSSEGMADVDQDIMNIDEEIVGPRSDPFAGTLALLEQTSEAAFIRTAMLGELSKLIVQLRQSTNWIKDAWFVIDLDGYCMYMNPAAEALCDLRMEPVSSSYSNQMISMSIRDATVTIDAAFMRLRRRMRNAPDIDAYLREFSQDISYRKEVCAIVASDPLEHSTVVNEERQGREEEYVDHTDQYLQFTCYPLYTPQGGQLEAHALCVHDVTEQVREEKNRSALLSAVSHDLRTPLTTIKAAVTGLLQTNMLWNEQDRYEMLEDVNNETDHLTFLLNAWMELSRIEMGALDLAKEWCDILEIFYGVVPKIQPVLVDHHIETCFPSSLPLVYADHVQLGRVFYNLLENAARHSAEKSAIFVTIDTIIDGVEMLRVRVKDQGSLIPVHERERIFASYRHKTYGNVLGLAICRGIIQAHQGRIWVDGGEEPGACFTLMIPVYPQTSVDTDE